MTPRAIRLAAILILALLVILGAYSPKAVAALCTGAIGLALIAIIYGCCLCLQSTDDDREDL